MIRHQFNEHGCLSDGWLEPYFELGSCNETIDYDVCKEVNTMWNCTVAGSTNWAAFRQNAYKFDTKAVVDDCSAEPKCMGAPNGTITCDYTPLPSDAVYPTGLNVQVFGDRCSACGMKEDYCPNYYDAHSCIVSWEYETTEPAGETQFEINYKVSGAMVPGVSGYGLLVTAMLATLLTLDWNRQ